MSQEPYCFVLMPFGQRTDRPGSALIDFDHIYYEALLPAIRSAGLHPHRDDATAVGGIVQKQIYEALLLCDFAIAELTIENSNVFYELGVRHAVRPSSTLAISANVDNIPFDVSNLRTLRYRLDEHNFLDDRLATDLRDRVTQELQELRRHVSGRVDYADSPLFQLVEGWRPPKPQSMRTDLFAERVAYNESVKGRLARARETGLRGGPSLAAAVAQAATIRDELGDTEDVEAGVLVDLLLTYRAFEEWDAMCGLIDEMPGFLQARSLVREQLAFALNRRARERGEQDRDHALQILRDLVGQGRGSSETFGLIGRVHKDRWRDARDPRERGHHLRQAVDAYQRGFRMDPTDPYPGVNAATLLRIGGSPQQLSELAELLPVVKYAAERLLDVEKPTYWMHATLLEVSILRGADIEALGHLDRAVRAVGEVWEPRTTLGNITDLIESGGVAPGDWIDEILAELGSAAR